MTNTPPLYDTVRPIIDAWAERNLDLSHEEDVTIYLCLLNALLDGDDGLGYAIWNQAHEEGRLDAIWDRRYED